MAIKTKDESLVARLGFDLKFPINGNFEPISGLNLLLQDIQQLLLTVPGERVGRPTYGCNLRNQIWENIDQAYINGAAEIRAALGKYEPRINVTAVTGKINRNTGLIVFSIRFVVKSTDTSVNLIFPLRTSQQISAA
jgi:phage baseplate assembly protein W